jgi:glycosyltransferase involved in cell wall biosynthesis
VETHIGIIPFQDHSMFHIAVPIKLFEYMLHGCAVLSSNLPPIYEFAENTVAYYSPGDSIDLRNKLHELILNSDLRNKYANAGLEKSKDNYVWSQVEKTFLSTVLD